MKHTDHSSPGVICLRGGLVWLFLIARTCLAADDPALVGHWMLEKDCRDRSSQGLDGRNHGVHFTASETNEPLRAAAQFDGRGAYVEVPDEARLDFGRENFSISVWVWTDAELDDVLGDIISKYDARLRRGFQLSIQNYAGVTSAQSNYRHILFGIDDGQIDATWTDCGRPGNNLFVFALAVYDGHLYAGTFEFQQGETGHVYRYDGVGRWVDCGSPDRCNAIESLAVFDGKLYAGSCHYLSSGSALADSPNTEPGGSVFRYEGGTEWTACGRLENPETGAATTVGGMAVYRGELYAGTLPLAEVHRYEGGTAWTRTGQLDTTPDVPYRRAWSMAVFQGKLFCGTLPSGHVYSMEAGKSVTFDHELAPGWRHLVTVKNDDRLQLYVDGKRVATSVPFDSKRYDVSNEAPLQIGLGQHDSFHGRMRDVRIYARALSGVEVEKLFSEQPPH